MNFSVCLEQVRFLLSLSKVDSFIIPPSLLLLNCLYEESFSLVRLDSLVYTTSSLTWSSSFTVLKSIKDELKASFCSLKTSKTLTKYEDNVHRERHVYILIVM